MHDADTQTKLFVVQVHPQTGPHSIIIRAAASRHDAERLAKETHDFGDAPTTVYECPLTESVFISLGAQKG